MNALSLCHYGKGEIHMKAAPMTSKPSFPLMKQGDIQNIYHLQMPRWLFTDPRYMGLAQETKVAYTFLLNRFQLSRLNGWVNEDGAVFIIYTRRSLAEEMQVSYRKIIESMKELSTAGLIWERRCGRGDANQIYLALVEHDQPKAGSAPFVGPEHEAAGGAPEGQPFAEGDEPDARSAGSALLDGVEFQGGASLSTVEVPEQHFKKCGDGTSASAGMELPEVPEWHPNYKDKSHTDLNHTDVSPSVPRGSGPADDEAELMGILAACELQCFSDETARVFENAIERLYYADSFRVGNATLPQRRVRVKLKLLDYTILQTAEAKLHANLDRPVKNSTAYTMATIFNCIAESESDVMVDPYLNGLNAPPGR